MDGWTTQNLWAPALCKSLHLGKFNPGHIHNMNGEWSYSIEIVSKTKRLIDKLKQLKFHEHSYILCKQYKKSKINDSQTCLLNRSILPTTLEITNAIWGHFYTIDQTKVVNAQRAVTRL